MSDPSPFQRPSPADDVLRAQLQDALRHPEPVDLAPLESRVLAQWALRNTPAPALVASGPVARLRMGLTHHPVALGAAALVLAAALVVVVVQRRVDPALQELMEPDVLSLISAGEL